MLLLLFENGTLLCLFSDCVFLELLLLLKQDERLGGTVEFLCDARLLIGEAIAHNSIYIIYILRTTHCFLNKPLLMSGRNSWKDSSSRSSSVFEQTILPFAQLSTTPPRLPLKAAYTSSCPASPPSAGGRSQKESS